MRDDIVSTRSAQAEAAIWKERYQRIQDDWQNLHSELMRQSARIDALESRSRANSLTPEERAAQKADVEDTRKRRFQEKVAEAAAARALKAANDRAE